MKIKLVALICLALILSILLTGCTSFTVDISDLIIPPEPSGKLGLIQNALYGYAGEDITLRYPKGGDYRSAYALYDLDGDGTEEAVAFYSTVSEENVNVMHLNLLNEVNGEWKSVGDIGTESSAVGSLEFCDADSDGTAEIIVTYNVSSSALNKLAVYSVNGMDLKSYIVEDCSAYTVCDLQGGGKSGLLLLAADAASHKGNAKYYLFDKDHMTLHSECPIDASVLSYYSPIVSTLKDGTPAVYFDADKGTEGAVTELLYVEDGHLTDAFVKIEGETNIDTLRNAKALTSDYNKDGIPDIPKTVPLPDRHGNVDEDSVFLTYWNDYENGTLVTVDYAVMNAIDGYSFTVDYSWVGKLAAVKKSSGYERVFYRYDSAMEVASDEIIRILVLDNGNKPSDADYKAVADNGSKTVYAIVAEDNPFGLTFEDAEARIKFIN